MDLNPLNSLFLCWSFTSIRIVAPQTGLNNWWQGVPPLPSPGFNWLDSHCFWMKCSIWNCNTPLISKRAWPASFANMLPTFRKVNLYKWTQVFWKTIVNSAAWGDSGIHFPTGFGRITRPISTGCSNLWFWLFSLIYFHGTIHVVMLLWGKLMWFWKLFLISNTGAAVFSISIFVLDKFWNNYESKILKFRFGPEVSLQCFLLLPPSMLKISVEWNVDFPTQVRKKGKTCG